MPATLNGVGTTYYGKSNAHTRVGTCHSCNHETQLTSYDTKHWFVVLFIPLIPLGKKHIIDECSRCRKHLVIDAREWEKVLNERDEWLATFARNPAKAEFVNKALTLVIQTNDMAGLDHMSSEIERHYADDTDMLMMLASAHARYNKNEDVRRVLSRIVEINSDKKYRAMLADILLDLGEPDEAVPYLSHVYTHQETENVGILLKLGQVYQNEGRHEEALLAFDQATELAPELAKKRELTKLRQASESRMGTQEKVSSAKIIKRTRFTSQSRKIAITVAAILVIGALIASITSISIKNNRKVYLVNGLEHAYTVSIADQTHTINPMSKILVKVPEGQVTVSCDDPVIPQRQQSTQIQSNFIDRLFDDRTFVLNPDHAAVLRYKDEVYSRSGSNGNTPARLDRYQGGQFAHVFRDVDYAFIPSPDTLRLEESQKVVTKHSLSLIRATGTLSYDQYLNYLSQNMTKRMIKTVLKQRYLGQPDREYPLQTLANICDTQEFIALLEPLLDKRPVMVPAHRIYQNVMLSQNEDKSLFKRYNQYLASEPENHDIQYLCARLVKPAKYKDMLFLCKKAITAPDPSPDALRLLAELHAENGLFDKAIGYIEQGWEAGLSHESTDGQYLQYLTAAGLNKKAMDFSVKMQAKAYSDEFVFGFTEQAYLYELAKNHKDAQMTLDRCRSKLRSQSRNAIESFLSQQKSVLAYVAGDRQTYIESHANNSFAEARFSGCVASGDARGALMACKENYGTYDDFLLVYIVAQMNHNEDVAKEAFDIAIKQLEDGNSFDRELANILAWKSKVTFNAFLHMSLGMNEKKICLTAMGMRYPKIQKQCFVVARKLNYDLRPPHLTLAQAMIPDDLQAK